MKEILLSKPVFRIILIVISMLALFAWNKSMAGKTPVASYFTVKVVADDEAILVSVNAKLTNELQFYMFSLDGNLVKRSAILGTTVMKRGSLKKGTYLYDVFDKDARLISGRLDLK